MRWWWSSGGLIGGQSAAPRYPCGARLIGGEGTSQGGSHDSVFASISAVCVSCAGPSRELTYSAGGNNNIIVGHRPTAASGVKEGLL